MCGRYQLTLQASSLQCAASSATWHPGHATEHQPNNQIRPTNRAPVLVVNRSDTAGTADKHLKLMRWGFQSSRSGASKVLINARCETLLELPTFRDPLLRPDSRRCAVPTTGFYEWKKGLGMGKMPRTPYLVHPVMSSPVAYMAGIFNVFQQDLADMESFVIVTAEASKQFQWLHNRQPVFLSTQQQIDVWLDPHISAQHAISILSPNIRFQCTRMTKDLSSSATDTHMVQRPLEAFFTKSDHDKPNVSNQNALPSKSTSLKIEKPILKTKRRPTSASTKQKKISSFFSPVPNSTPKPT